MYKLKDLIGAIQKEVALTQEMNVKTLASIGLEVTLTAKEMIGHDRPEWAPLADSTIERKAYAGQGMNGDPSSPLYADGTYKDDINFQVEPPVVCIGTDLPYAQCVEHGRPGQPPRPLFEPAFTKAWEKIAPKLGDGYLKTFK